MIFFWAEDIHCRESFSFPPARVCWVFHVRVQFSTCVCYFSSAVFFTSLISGFPALVVRGRFSQAHGSSASPLMTAWGLSSYFGWFWQINLP
ncbi:hypothetical protein BGX38DRAFT_121612 [Terfezia claveryi]|nr:hypothetical protein BGX38DRAFT_121612 [Terfezia claveryi]